MTWIRDCDAAERLHAFGKDVDEFALLGRMLQRLTVRQPCKESLAAIGKYS